MGVELAGPQKRAAHIARSWASLWNRPGLGGRLAALGRLSGLGGRPVGPGRLSGLGVRPVGPG